MEIEYILNLCSKHFTNWAIFPAWNYELFKVHENWGKVPRDLKLNDQFHDEIYI